MVRRGILGLVFAGCAAAPASTVPATTVPATTAIVAPPEAVGGGPRLGIRFEPLLNPIPRLGVEVTARGISETVWRFAAPVAAEPRDLTARDDAGDLAFAQGREGQALVVRFARAPTGTLKIRYVLHATDATRAGPEVPADLLLRVDHTRILAAAEEALLLPDGGEVVGLELGLVVSPPRLLQVASTLGAPGWQGPVRLHALRHAAFLIGPLGRAEFRGPEGDDDFAWSGETAFDLRWVAAETAGARTAVDAFFGASETQRFTGLLAVDIDFAGGGGTSVHPRGGGLYVAIAPGSEWDARARLAVAHGLVHRWIGGRLQLRGPGEAPEVGAWFAAGFARMVAREVLFDLGTLSGRDYAEEVNAHQAVVATARLRAASNAEVAAAATGGDAEALALLTARGVLYATRLAALLRTKGRSLKGLLGELVVEAQQAGAAELPLAAFTGRVTAALGAGELASFEAGVLQGRALTLPGDALGPCFVRRPRTYTRFDLGFDERATLAETPPQVRGLRAGGPAARAGVKEGEPLMALSVDPDDLSALAVVTVERGGRGVEVKYRPVSAPGRGDGWLRRPGADERACPP